MGELIGRGIIMAYEAKQVDLMASLLAKKKKKKRLQVYFDNAVQPTTLGSYPSHQQFTSFILT